VTTSDTDLFLIRHGESQAQVGGYVSGHDTCKGLSGLGHRQAEALRDRLIATGELSGVDALYTSILSRAVETAATIAPALGAVEPVAECEWCEIHAGEAEGLQWSEIAERFPVAGNHDFFETRFPGGETWAEFFVRAGARLRRVAREHEGERVVVVCHGGVIGASFVALGDLTIGNAHTLTHEAINSSITQWRRTAAGWRLVRFNDAAHLARLEH
jgi:probable phosphoglycerate mutase